MSFGRNARILATAALGAAAVAAVALGWAFAVRPQVTSAASIGHQAWVDFSSAASAIALVLLIVVVVERRRRRNLQAADQRLRAVLDLTTDAILTVDHQLNVVRFNAAAGRVFGYAETEIVGQPIACLIAAADRDRYLRLLHRFEAGRSRDAVIHGDREIHLRRRDDSLFPAAVRLAKSPAETNDHITIAIQDIAAHRATEAKLEWERNLLRAFFEAWPDLVFAKDTESRFIAANPKTAEIMGVPSSEELIGRTDFDYYPPETAAELFSGEQEIIATGNGVIAERSRLVTLTGDEIWLSTTKIPLRDGRGRIVGLVGVNRDITAEKDAETALSLAKEQAELANRAKSEFIANMSHELRTPLNAVIGFSEIIASQSMGPVGTEVYGEYATDIRDAGQHLLDLINDILDLSKVESGTDELHEETMDVAELADSVTRLLAERAQRNGIIVTTTIADYLPHLLADKRKLKQILSNMLSNAVKFTESGGRVDLKIWCDDARDFVFQVSDTGIGIAPQDIGVAMAQFGQVDSRLSRQHEGTGLGLPLTKALVERHGGTFALHSELGVGTTATATLPGRAEDRPERATA